MPRVSVVIPCYNAESTLAEALDSILAQTYRDFEIILFNDGSTDRTATIADSYSKRIIPILPIHSHHVGIVEGLQRACTAATGEFIARMDADDIAHPKRLAAQVALLDASPEVPLCGTLTESFGEAWGSGRERYDNWINGLVDHEHIARELFVECPIPHPTFCMRRSAFEEAGGYKDHGWAEDYDLVMRFALADGKLQKVPRVLLRWRNHGARLSANDSRYSDLSFRALKRHYLFQSYLANERPFIQWGAGEVGKLWLREWGADAWPHDVIDINPRKVGRVIHGRTIRPPDWLCGPDERLILIAVGAPGAREEIRAYLNPRGYRELQHYLFVA